MSEVRFIQLEDQGDARGALYRVPSELLSRFGPVGNIHFGEVRPGAFRGNHAHRGNSELLIVHWQDRCQLAYDNGEGQPPVILELEGQGSAALLLPPLCAHALHNTGEEMVEFTSLPSSPFDLSDVIRRTLLS